MKACLLPIILLAAFLSESNAIQIKIPVPQQNWQMSFDGPILRQEKSSVENGAVQYSANAGRFNVSAFVEPPANTDAFHQAVLDHYWTKASRNPLIQKESIQQSTTPRFARVQYTIEGEHEGQKFTQLNVNYYFAHQGKWVDLHVSMVFPNDADAHLIKIIDKTLAYGPLLLEDGKPKDLPLGALGSVLLKIPPGWQLGNLLVNDSSGTDQHTLSFYSPTSINSRALLTFFERGQPLTDKDKFQKEIIDAIAPALESSVEKKADLQPFELSGGTGYYTVITDASLVGKPIEPGNAKVIASGMILPEPHILGIVTVFVDDATSDDFKAMLKAINSFRLFLPRE